MRSGSAIALLLSAAALAVPASAAAKVTREDRAFARAFERYDAAMRAAAADPPAVAALRARQHAAAGCADAVRALNEADKGQDDDRLFDAFFYYYFYVADPFLDAVVRADDAYVHALKRMRLHNPTLRSARAVLILITDVRPPAHAVLADFCGPMRAWQAAGFATGSAPPQIKTMSDFVDHAPFLTVRRRATLQRADVRMRAAGMPRAVRERFVEGGDLDLDKLLRGDQVLAAFQAH